MPSGPRAELGDSATPRTPWLTTNTGKNFTVWTGPNMADTLVALAIAAHPDDIEFQMAGTLLLLKNAGAEIHMWNLANGYCGTTQHSPEEIVAIRWKEAQESARRAGAKIYPPLFNDLEIFYDRPALGRVASVIRQVQPNIVLTQPMVDYMEDHQDTGRLAVSAAFVRNIKNFITDPSAPPYFDPVRVYHSLPHGLCDWYGRPVVPEFYVNIESVLAGKRKLLACHRSQKEWLDASQGMDAYLDEMERMSREVGARSGVFKVAEGWTKHSPTGFCAPDYDPIKETLGKLVKS